MTIKTRFAPSPTGLLHLGNVRTALFNALMARQQEGAFLLRIEDTDQDRSKSEFVDALQEDLSWLGLHWQEGPGEDQGKGPYFQSQRGELYQKHYTKLEEEGLAYPCFCTSRELDISRKLQRSAGNAPRYAGTCAHLSADEVAAKREQGIEATLRFRVPRGETIEYDDLVQGHKRFLSDDIGDFIIRRADGTPAFFFTNAVDDALMEVNYVLRGVDHETNTPRQLMLLSALQLPLPTYGHISLIVADDGKPLSKRSGSRGIADLRASGYLPIGITNFLSRLGHKYEKDGFMDEATLGKEFNPERLGRAPARFDEAQLQYWQKEAVHHASDSEIGEWLGAELAHVPEHQRSAFVTGVRENIVMPTDAAFWVERIYSTDLQPSEEALRVMTEAAADVYAHALTQLEEHGDDFKALAKAVGKAAGVKGKGLFMPLRAALTGETHGPNLGGVLPLIGVDAARLRLQAAQNLPR